MPVMIACALASVNSTAWADQSNEKSNERDEGKGCSNQTLHGDYGLTIEGLLNIPGPGIQVRGVVMQSFDGNGYFTQVDHVVVNGMPPPLEWMPVPAPTPSILIALERQRSPSPQAGLLLWCILCSSTTGGRFDRSRKIMQPSRQAEELSKSSDTRLF